MQLVASFLIFNRLKLTDTLLDLILRDPIPEDSYKEGSLSVPGRLTAEGKSAASASKKTLISCHLCRKLMKEPLIVCSECGKKYLWLAFVVIRICCE